MTIIDSNKSQLAASDGRLYGESGWMAVSLLALLPLLMSILAVVAAGNLVIVSEAETKHQCRATLLLAQERAAQSLRRLMDLNKQAQRLRSQHRAAELKVMTSPPAAQPAALANLARVEMLQMALAAKQNLIILNGKRQSATGAGEAARAMRTAAWRRARAQTEGLSLAHASGNWLSPRHGQFELHASPAGSITPDYRPVPRFSETQVMEARAALPVGALLPRWLGHWVSHEGLTINIQCASTLIYEGGKWQPALIQDKSLSSSL